MLFKKIVSALPWDLPCFLSPPLPLIPSFFPLRSISCEQLYLLSSSSSSCERKSLLPSFPFSPLVAPALLHFFLRPPPPPPLALAAATVAWDGICQNVPPSEWSERGSKPQTVFHLSKKGFSSVDLKVQLSLCHQTGVCGAAGGGRMDSSIQHAVRATELREQGPLRRDRGLAAAAAAAPLLID